MTRHQPTASNAEPNSPSCGIPGYGLRQAIYLLDPSATWSSLIPSGTALSPVSPSSLPVVPPWSWNDASSSLMILSALECPSLRSIAPIKRAIDNYGHHPQQCAPGTQVWCRLRDITGDCLYFRC